MVLFAAASWAGGLRLAGVAQNQVPIKKQCSLSQRIAQSGEGVLALKKAAKPMADVGTVISDAPAGTVYENMYVNSEAYGLGWGDAYYQKVDGGIGGVDVARITDRERRTCIGCVEQHFSRVPGTVLDQIALGDPQITEEMAKHAARLAGIDAAVQALPEGYHTVCTEGLFSQGEWQLLSIARAAAANPAVLLLDEITANLDAETEQRVLAALRRACEGRTVLSVSHRIYENLGGRTIEIGFQRNAALSHV